MNAETLDAVSRAIGTASKEPFSPIRAAKCSGGSVSQCYVLSDGQRRYFVKTNAGDAVPMFEAEADGLSALSACGAFRVPEVLALGRAGSEGFIVLEHLDLTPLSTREDGQRVAHALATLHGTEGDAFGWRRDNFIGRSPQHNPPHDNWPWFFAHHRLAPQLERAGRNGMSPKMVAKGERLCAVLGALFVGIKVQPSLVHGDLWHGNVGICHGQPALFDPAVHYGHRETDLAMAELFGGFPESFYAAYRAAWPLEEGFEQRKTLYSLYHILNHFNLFGGGYLRQTERMIESMLSELGQWGMG